MGFFGFLKPNPEKMEKKGDVPGLIKALGHTEQDVRDKAGEALCRICTVQHLDFLKNALSSEQWRVRAGVAIVLGCINDDLTVAPLMGLLKDPHAQVRRFAAESLEKIEWSPSSEGERVSHQLATGDWYGLGDLGEEAIGPLTEALSWGDASVRTSVVMAMGRIKSPLTVDVLGERLLQDEDHNVRLNSALSLRDGGVEAVGLLVESLKDPVWEVRNSAAETLAQIGEPAVEALIKALESPVEYSRSRAAYSLGRIRNTRAVEPLIECLDDEKETVRWNVVKALGEINDPTATGPISVLLKDKIRSIQWQATLALLNNHEGVEIILEALKSSDSGYRYQDLIAGMGDTTEKGAVDSIIIKLGSEEAEIKWNAVVALGKIGDPKAIPNLLELIGDKNSEMRGNIVMALGDIGSKEAVDPLLEALKDHEVKVRTHAVDALARIGDTKAVLPFIELLDESDSNMKIEIVRALGDLGDTRALPVLEKMLVNADDDIKYTIERAVDDLKREK